MLSMHQHTVSGESLCWLLPQKLSQNLKQLSGDEMIRSMIQSWNENVWYVRVVDDIKRCVSVWVEKKARRYRERAREKIAFVDESAESFVGKRFN